MTDNFEIIHPDRIPNGKVRAAVFDFDGTISTLRCGWEIVMRGLMIELLYDGTKETENKIDAYIDSSTGIQTVYQMKWLKEQVDAIGRGDVNHDVWWYKDEYNRRLMEEVSTRKERLKSGLDSPNKYLISGAVDFVKTLKDAGIELYLASGTDHDDVSGLSKSATGETEGDGRCTQCLFHFFTLRFAPPLEAGRFCPNSVSRAIGSGTGAR